MNYMKKLARIICLVLACVLCLSLAACASQEDKDFEAANALLEAGDYDGAIAAFSAIGRYQEISDKIAEAVQLRDEANGGFLVGNWRDTHSNSTMYLNSDGSAFLHEYESIDFSYRYADNKIVADAPLGISFDVTEMDGVTHLVASEKNYDFVLDADYAPYEPKEVQITLDNWDEYFELREADNVMYNEFGDVTYNSPGYGVFLKEAFYTRFASADVDFEMTYDEACYKIIGFTPESSNWSVILNDYELESATPPYWIDLGTGCTATATVYDYNRWDKLPEEPYYQKIAAEFFVSGGLFSSGSTMYCTLVSNPQITRVQGSMMLRPE